MVSVPTATGVIMAQIPITTIRLKILEPTALLTASALFPLKDAVTLTAVSGSDVPIATIVRPITFCETPNSSAMTMALSTRRSAPIAIKAAPRTRRIMSFNKGQELGGQKYGTNN